MKPNQSYQRYERQLLLNGFGITGQEKLHHSRVLMIGAGGLGCPALQYLAAAGVDTIGILDFDVVELTNLQRQTLFNVDDIGKYKAQTAAEKLMKFNPDIEFIVHQTKIESANAVEIISGYDIVIDGTDNFATRYLVNDACVLLHKPLVYGSVLRYEGQAGVFNLRASDENYSANYRDLFPEPPRPETVPSCNEAGVLGVLPGIIGTMQATEAIKIITGIGTPLSNKILSCNVMENLFYEFEITPSKQKNQFVPKTIEEFKQFNYEWFCGNTHQHLEISPTEFEILRKESDITVIDVRELGELPFVDEFPHVQLPLSEFEDEITKLNLKERVVLFCKSGHRSLTALNILLRKYPHCKAYNLKGGITAYKKFLLTFSVSSTQT